MNNDNPQPNNGLDKRVDDIEFKSNKYDFSSLQVINKNAQINGFLRLKNFTTAPTPALVGDIAVIGGVLKICTVGGSSPTWTVVGTQT